MSYHQFGHVDRDERIDLAADEPVGEPARWSSTLPSPLLTALVMAVFAGGIYVAYIVGTHHAAPSATPVAAAAQPQLVAPAPVAANQPQSPADNIPVIRADPQPLKVKPDQPGGLAVPDRDKLIYSERPGGPPVERLLPPPEQPQPRPVAPPPAPPAAAQAGQAQGPATPMVVQQAPVPPAPPLARGAPAPAAKAHPTPTAAEEGGVKGGHIRVQLGSLRSPDEARDEWQRLKHAAPELLGKLTADAVRADLGERGIYYRIEAGSFAEPAAAARLCRELKERHLGCSVVR